MEAKTLARDSQLSLVSWQPLSLAARAPIRFCCQPPGTPGRSAPHCGAPTPFVLQGDFRIKASCGEPPADAEAAAAAVERPAVALPPVAAADMNPSTSLERFAAVPALLPAAADVVACAEQERPAAAPLPPPAEQPQANSQLEQHPGVTALLMARPDGTVKLLLIDGAPPAGSHEGLLERKATPYPGDIPVPAAPAPLSEVPLTDGAGGAAAPKSVLARFFARERQADDNKRLSPQVWKAGRGGAGQGRRTPPWAGRCAALFCFCRLSVRNQGGQSMHLPASRALRPPHPRRPSCLQPRPALPLHLAPAGGEQRAGAQAAAQLLRPDGPLLQEPGPLHPALHQAQGQPAHPARQVRPMTCAGSARLPNAAQVGLLLLGSACLPLHIQHHRRCTASTKH